VSKKFLFFVVDLSDVGEKEKITCPKCEAEISPNDKTEDVYTILEPVMKGAQLEKIIIKCNRCRSRIHLVGFDVIQKHLRIH